MVLFSLYMFQIKKRFAPIFLASAIAGAVIVCHVAPFDVAGKSPGWFAFEHEIPARLLQVRRGSFPLELHGTGELRAVKQADVVSTIPGFLEQVRYKVGDAVIAGQVVASLRITELVQRAAQTEASLQAAQADLRDKQTRLADREKELERTRDLRARDLIAGQDLTAAEAAFATAQAQVDLGQAQVAQQQASLKQVRYLGNFFKLVAPFSGVVTRRVNEPGTYLRQSESVITIANLDVMSVMVPISAKDLDSIQHDMPARVTVEALSGRVLEGHVVEVHSASEVGDSNDLAEVHVANPEHLLKNEMRASVSLLTGEKRDVLLVPREAVTEIAGKTFVDVVVDRRVERKAVTVGRNREDSVEVAGPVHEGDWVVAGSRTPLTGDTRVRIVAEKTSFGR